MNESERSKVFVKSDFMVACGISDPGRHRPENEDAIFLDENGKFLLLADGMGGHERGAEASQTALEVIHKFFDPEVMASELADITNGGGIPSEISCLLSLVDTAVNKANDVVFEKNREAGLQRFMGTTVVGVVFVDGGYVLWFHVGDSRLYRWRNNSLQCLTADHSAYLEWERRGRHGEQPKKNIITRAIGPNPGVAASTEWDSYEPGDIYVLCSDGLTDMISEEQISQILSTQSEVEEIADLLIESANDAGGKDNVSTVVCRI